MSRAEPSGSKPRAAQRPSSSKVVSTRLQDISQNLLLYTVGTTEEKLPPLLEVRLQTWKDLKNPFGKPNSKSRAEVLKDAVLLPDNVLVSVEPNSREYIFAISSHFDIDEINAFILFHSFIYNQGLPEETDSRDNAEFVETILKEISPFFYEERRAVYRILVPLLRVEEVESEGLHDASTKFLPKIIPDRIAFTRTIASLYQEKTNAPLPEKLATDPRGAARWAQENLKDQLVLLELTFSSMFNFFPGRGVLVEELYRTAFDTNLGLKQENETFLLDPESSQLQKDIAAVWLLIMIEVLELDVLFFPTWNISNALTDKNLYISLPDSLHRIHKMVMDHQNVPDYSCIFLAWSITLTRLEAAIAELEDYPESHQAFFDWLGLGPSRSRDGRSVPQAMLQKSLGPDLGAFNVLLNLLTGTSLFVTSIAWKSDSAISDPNALSYRSILKGLLTSLSRVISLELIPDFETLLDVWISLFGRSESESVGDLCQQFWREDARHPAVRNILDLPRTRFPIQHRPLLQILRSLCGPGFSNSDPLASITPRQLDARSGLVRAECAKNAVVYLQNLTSYAQIIPAAHCSGQGALYEKVPERFGSSSAASGPLYTNIKPIRLPGGSLLPAKSAGRLLSTDGEEQMIVLWEHQHSGWLLLKEILYDYAVDRHLIPPGSTTTPSSQGVVVRAHGSQQPVTLSLKDIGVEVDADPEGSIIADILELLRTVIAVDPHDANALLGIIEQVDPEKPDKESRADLAYLVLVILEDALARSGTQSRKPKPAQTPLIASAFGLLASMMSVRDYARQVWLFCRSSTLFDNTKMYTSSVLAAERVSGSYPITRALLLFVQSMFTQAYSGVLITLSQELPKLQVYKEDVLMRALRFVHGEIWLDHVGWKYVQLSERFEVGRLLSTLYGDILDRVAPMDPSVPLASISRAVFEALVLKATTSSINPLITAITTSTAVLRHASSLRKFTDLSALWYLLKAHLTVIRLCLTYKQRLYGNEGHCLLEQALCSRASGNGTANGGSGTAKARADPLDALATFVSFADQDTDLPKEAVRVLYCLCSSLASTPSSALTIVGHLSNPEATVSSLVSFASDPYKDLEDRLAVWRFMALAVDKEPALGSLFVNGRFQIPVHKAREEPAGTSDKGKAGKVSGFKMAQMTIEVWQEMWEYNPRLLAAVLRFLAAVWEHGAEHGDVMESVKDDGEFWDYLSGIVKEELPPAPEYFSAELDGTMGVEGLERSPLDDGVEDHASRVLVKSYATRIVALDIGMRRVKGRVGKKDAVEEKPRSYRSIEGVLKSVDQLTDHMNDANANSYDPAIFEEFAQRIAKSFSNLSLKWLEWQTLPGLQELGDDYALRKTNLLSMTSAYVDEGDGEATLLMHNLFSINMNLSLSNVQIQLGESWQLLLQQVAPYIKGDPAIRPTILSLAATVAETIAAEQRAGDLMSNIHGVRLSVLLSLLELAWFSHTDSETEIKWFLAIVDSVRLIIVSESQSPILSIRGSVTTPFHRTLLQIIYFCLRQCRNLARKPKALDAERRLNISAMVDVTLLFVIDSLRFVFDSALGRLNVDLDTDMELLVAVFEQATRTDINPSTQLWLTRCQETDVLRASLNLFVQSDIVGLSQLPVLRARKRPLYTPHILTFHISFASLPTPAERLASEGVLIAYSNNSLTPIASSGRLDPSLPSDLPGERNPAQQAYCVMLSVVSGVITALGMQKHFFDKEACGFVQLYGSQIERALSWSVGDVLTLPGLEEMERTVGLFGSIAASAPASANRNEVTAKVLSAFSSSALLLIQQLNYALSHPNQLAGILEPITLEERAQLERETNAMGNRGGGGFAEVLDPTKRPFLARVVHRLFGLTSGVVCALIATGESDLVLRGEVEDLPGSVALVVPHSKVVLGEPASMGTLIELANCTLDILTHLVSRPAGQSLGPSLSLSISSTATSTSPLDVKQAMLTTQRTLECVLFYATTQLGAWLAKPELFEEKDGEGMGAGESAGAGAEVDADMESEMVESGSVGPGSGGAGGGENKKGGKRRESLSLAERLRRGMTGEMANELKSLMEKARPVLQRSRDAVGGGEKDKTVLGKGKGKEVEVDVVKILIGFLTERIVGRT